MILAAFFLINSYLQSFASVNEFSAQKTIELSATKIVIDGSIKDSKLCKAATNKQVATLILKDKRLKLICGGTEIYPEIKISNLVVAEANFDAYDTWSVEALFFINPSKDLFLELRTRSTYDPADDCEGKSNKDLEKLKWSALNIKACREKKLVCTHKIQIKKFDPKKNIFIDYSAPINTPPRLLSSDYYEKNCLTP